jgi:GDP-L-fucose synthase
MVRGEPRFMDHTGGLVMADLAFWKSKRVLVTGGAGFLGSYVVENLTQQRGVAPDHIVVPRSRTHDLRDLQNCLDVVRGCDIVIHLAAVTGGIGFSRSHPASQYYDSTLIDLNMAEAARRTGVRKMVTIGNLFAYAPEAPSPLTEDTLFQGLPAVPHRGVGWMKRNLAILADLYHREYKLPIVVVYSANAYGPRDSVDQAHAHVVPATIMKCLRDKELVVWGDGSPTRDFLFAADVAEGLLLAAERLDSPGYVNLGSESEVSIRELVALIVRYTGFQGLVSYDVSKAGGDLKRLASAAKARDLLDFRPVTSIEDGMRRTVDWYRERLAGTSPANE